MKRLLSVWESISEPVKHLFDSLSLGAIVATFIGVLPHIATLLSVIWFALRIYESDTVQKALGKKNDA